MLLVGCAGPLLADVLPVRIHLDCRACRALRSRRRGLTGLRSGRRSRRRIRRACPTGMHHLMHILHHAALTHTLALLSHALSALRLGLTRGTRTGTTLVGILGGGLLSHTHALLAHLHALLAHSRTALGARCVLSHAHALLPHFYALLAHAGARLGLPCATHLTVLHLGLVGIGRGLRLLGEPCRRSEDQADCGKAGKSETGHGTPPKCAS